MKGEIIENINQAFLQLEYSIKLLTYTELEKIDKEEFDTGVVIQCKKSNLCFDHSTFKTYDDLVLAAENAFNITLGFTAIVLDSSLQTIGIEPNPQDCTPKGMLRTLIWMIRCAYAHDMMHPKWKITGAYAHSLTISLENETLELDLSQKNGHPFDINDIGGHRNYFEIKDKVCQLILES